MIDPVMTRILDCTKSQTELARLVGKSQSTVQYWFSSGRVPPEHVLDVERVTGIPRQEIRPDIYPPEDHSGAAA
mgnify:CR=1 FL=1